MIFKILNKKIKPEQEDTESEKTYNTTIPFIYGIL